MDKVTQVNIEGHNYGFVAGQAVKGSCTSNAGDWVKTIVLPEGAELTEGMVVATLFLNTNSVGFSDPITIYSATGNIYYYDPEMTEPVILPPYEDCYIIEHVSGTEYTYQAFPVAVINGERIPVCDSRGRPCGGPIWSSGDTIASLYLDDKLLMLHSTTTDQVQSGSTLSVTSGAVAARCAELEPVDAVTAANMKAVTSNAVAQTLGLFKSYSFGRSGAAAGRYILLATANGATASIAYISFSMTMLYHNGTQFVCGNAVLDVTFYNQQCVFSIKGYTDVPINSTYQRLPAFVVTKSGDTSYLYLDSNEQWLAFRMYVKNISSFVTVPNNFVEYGSVTGTSEYNSRGNSSAQIAIIGGNGMLRGTCGILGGAWGGGETSLAALYTHLCGQQSDGRMGMGGICGGSFQDTDGWRTYLYVPHRTGIDGDNYKYGTLITFPMTNQNAAIYIYRNTGTGFSLIKTI